MIFLAVVPVSQVRSIFISGIKMRKFILPLFLLSTLQCQSLFYYPDHDDHFPPEKFNIVYREIIIPDEKFEIHARFFPAVTEGEAKGTIVQFHGNAENLKSHYISLVWLTRQGYNLFIYDYPGYGDSSGKTTRKNIRKTAGVVTSYIQEKKEKGELGKKLFFYGQSLGGTVMMEALIKNRELPLNGFILEATFDSYTSIALSQLTRHWYTYPLIPFLYVTIFDFGAPHGKLDTLYPGTPKLILHGTADRTIPPRFAEHIYKEMAGPTTLKLIEGADHLGLYNLSSLGKKDPNKSIVLEFLESCN